jgi:hypothetical protein
MMKSADLLLLYYHNNDAFVARGHLHIPKVASSLWLQCCIVVDLIYESYE